MAGKRTTPFHVGLTAQSVVDAAVDLTAESHLMGWSIRDLAGRLTVAPSVIYHHVGGKDQLCRNVTERVLLQVRLPSETQPWDLWFRDFLYEVGPLLGRYPGVAKWILMHGPTTPAMLPTLKTCVAVLDRAGFGDQSLMACALLLNTATLTVSMTDDRLLHEEDGPRDHATMMEEFSKILDDSPREDLRTLGEGFIRPFSEGGPAATQVREAYYRFVVDVTIAGLADRVSPGGP